MIQLTTSLQEALDDPTQVVRPNVVARFVDSRLIDNYITSSSSEFYEKQILNKGPQLYWRFPENATGKTTTPDLSGNAITGILTDVANAQSCLARKNYKFPIINDAFTRSNNATNLGATSDGNGHSYEIFGDAIFGITGNQAYISNYKDFGTALAPVALIDTGGRDGYIQFEFGATPQYTQGCVVRYVDSLNYVYWIYGNFIFDYLAIVKVVDGVTTVADQAITSASSGDVIKLQFIDNDYTAYKNGVVVNEATITDSVFDDPSLTKHGLFHGSYATFSGARWDNFEASTYNVEDRSIYFDGVTSSVVGTVESAVNTRMDYTISLWAKPSTVATEQTLLSYENAGDKKWRLYLDGGVIVGEFFDNASTSYALYGGSAVIDTWYNIVLRKSGTAIDIFVDGTLISTSVMAEYIKDLEAGEITAGMDNSGGGNEFNGYLDEIAVFTEALTDKEIEMFYQSALNDGTFVGAGTHFVTEQAINGFDEESLAWAVVGAKDEWNNRITACGEYYTVEEEPIHSREYGVWTRTKSDEFGAFSQREEFWVEFDDLTVNKLELSTGYILGRVKEFTYYIRQTDGVVISGSDYFGLGESTKTIELDDTYDIDAIGFKFDSTWTTSDYGRIYQLNPIYDVDISDYVVDFSIEKVRDNYDSTLPIGLTSSNSGSITLDNTSKVFNKYDAESLYGKYMIPETKLFISLSWQTNAYDAEDIVIYNGLYIDHWALSSDAMTINGTGRDWSKYIQEEAKSAGEIFERVTAGRAIATIMKKAGYPSRKVSFYDTFHRSITSTRPHAFWRLSDIDATLVDYGGNFPGTYTGAGYTQGRESIIANESEAIKYDINRIEDSAIIDDNKKTMYSTYFNGASGTYASVSGAASALSFENDWSVAVAAQASGLPSGVGDISFIVSKYDSGDTDYNYAIGLKKTATGYVFVGLASSSLGTLYTLESAEYTSAEVTGVTFNIAFVKDDLSLTLYVDGVSVDTDTMDSYTSYTSTANLVIADRVTGTTGDQFDGYIGSVALWSRPLTATEINRIYICSSISWIYVFEYLFYTDSTVWDAMLEFATADLGMFYFDEDEVFRYEYSDIFHDGAITRHSEVQKIIDDDNDIISGQYDIDVQSNSITVNINPLVSAARNYEEIWRAEDGASLAVTKITQNMTSDQTSVTVYSTDSPLWFNSGYFKVGDEIISYSGKTSSSLTGLQRGQFGTLAANHATNDLCREVRVFDVEYSSKPVTNVKLPFITAKIFDLTVDVEKFKTTEYGCQLVISANENNAVGDLVVLEGTNPVTELDNFLAISGVVIEEKKSNEKVKLEVRDISSNIKRYKKKELIIDNKFIQDKDYAAKIADFLIRFFGLPISILTLEVVGLPELELGDLIQISNFDQLSIVDRNYWVIENHISYDGGIRQTLKLREYVESL